MTVVPIFNLKEAPRDKLELIMSRSKLEIDRITDEVREIFDYIKTEGDTAVRRFSKMFDKVELEEFKVSTEEFDEADKSLDQDVKESILEAAGNIRRFHQAQIRSGLWFTEVDKGVLVGQINVPLQSVGIYVPGGRGAFPSTALMGAIPAKVAGVEKIFISTPPRRNGKVDDATLFAAKVSGVNAVYKVGGAQAIAALALGTEIIPKVDKIIGPGGIWVAAAKKLAQTYSEVDIDFIAGPSENLVLADNSADPRYVASDVLIEVEHGSDSAGVVVTTSREIAEKVQTLIEKYISDLPDHPISRRTFALEALKNYGAIIIVKDMAEALNFINDYSPEHLEIMTHDPLHVLKKVKNAGSIFLGKYSPSTTGCYAAGVNHIIPTGGGAKKHSPLSVTDFIKKLDITFLNKEGLEKLYDTIKSLAQYEGFPQHFKAVEVRFKKA